MPRRPRVLLLFCSAAAWVAPTHPRRAITRHAAEEDDDPYLSPRSRLAGYVLNGGTEPAFSSPLNDIKQSGDFVCARKGCDAVLFRTDTKYDSGTGWPSFWDPVDDNVKLEKGNFLSFMFGTECKCAKCDGHLGHRFDDGPIIKPVAEVAVAFRALALGAEHEAEEVAFFEFDIVVDRVPERGPARARVVLRVRPEEDGVAALARADEVAALFNIVERRRERGLRASV